MIKKVEYISDYRLKVTFFDGAERLIDLADLVTRSNSSIIREYADLSKFKKVKIGNGTICWGPRGEFDIDPYMIYDGEFEASDSPYKDLIRPWTNKVAEQQQGYCVG